MAIIRSRHRLNAQKTMTVDMLQWCARSQIVLPMHPESEEVLAYTEIARSEDNVHQKFGLTPLIFEVTCFD